MENANPIGKAVNNVLQQLAILYKECHKLNPDSPTCAAIQGIIKAVSDVEMQVTSEGMPGPAPVNPMDDMAEDAAEAPAGPMPPAINELGPAPEADGMRGAAQGVKAAMLRAAQRRDQA